MPLMPKSPHLPVSLDLGYAVAKTIEVAWVAATTYPATALENAATGSEVAISLRDIGNGN